MSDYYQGDPRGHSTNNQRDAAFNNIFGAPPPGRSQTMTSSSIPPHMMAQQGRTHTMQSSMSGMSGMQRQPPPRTPHHQYVERQRPMDDGTSNAYPGQRSISGGYQIPSSQSQYLHQQQARRGYGGPPPPRPDSRGAPSGAAGAAGARTPAQRFHQGGSGPAMMNDPYRSQSLASAPRPQQYAPPPNTYQHAPANSFRQVSYNQANSARTTAQGRVVPERHEDRSMSMTGHHPQERDNQYHQQQQGSYQTMSGRVIPNRRAPVELPASNGPAGGAGYGNAGFPVPPGSQTRTTSIASSNGEAPQRTMSMASSITIPVTPADSDGQASGHRPSMSKSGKSIDSERPPTAKIRAPLVYPAMISRVAECFRNKIITGDRTKNELTYKSAFSGAEAVDVLSYIIRTTDRNLALLLGRALDAQKFFHDVTYEHRLRDSTSEMYQFRETLNDQPDEKSAVNGVFVLLSECYSPTCTRDNLCYSIACPRRLEQVSRLNLKMQPVLKKEDTAVANEDDADQTDEQKLWINSVPAEVAEKVDEREKKRQEVISEICYTERDFVKDLEYLRDFWILPLRSKASPIPGNRRERVVKAIFSNIIDHPSLHTVSSRLARALTERQQKDPVVNNLGDVFLEFVPQFEPFILYGSKQMEAKHEFENEKAINPYFAKFVDEIERRKESRKLELNGYLTKPTTRLARYPLLLEAVLKYSEEGNSDREDLPKVLTVIRDLLSRVNRESGKAENRFQLKRLQESLRFRPNERVDLRLTEDGREIVFKSQLRKTPQDTSPTNEITAYLFDHAVLLVRVKQAGKGEEVKAYRRVSFDETRSSPMPLAN